MSNKLNNIFIVDYACHPFSLDLAYKFSKKNYSIKYFFSNKINLTKNFYKFYKKDFSIFPIDVGEIPKHNFILRRYKEIRFGKEIIDKIIKYKPKKIILVNLPIDPLYRIIKFCKKRNIKTYFWIQDIYYLAIRNFFKKKKLLFFLIGYLISRIYEYYEKYCYLNSTKNILITKKFLNFFPYKKKNYIKENWVPLADLKIKDFNKKVIVKLSNSFNFIYTGTLSYKHQSDILLSLAEKFRDANIIILSNDKFAKELFLKAKKKSLKNFIIHKLVSYDELPTFLKNSDIGLVNLNQDSNNVCVPSKILTYYKYGLPILASMPLSNPASQNILKYKTGLVSNPNQIEQYLSNAFKLMNNTKLRKKFSKNGKDFAIKNFNIKKISKEFIKILEL